MKISILTIFPKMINFYLNESIIKKAISKKLVEIQVVDIRQFANSPVSQVDDYLYGGGDGMLMIIEPIVKAINSVKKPNSHIILTTPQGKTLNQQTVKGFIKDYQDLIIICGHYEGIDARIKYYIDEEISIGDYVMTGGELSALVLTDTITRLVDGVIKKDSAINESFEDNLLDYDSYTKPAIYDNHQVPQVLLSGHHENIKTWRRQSQLKNTYLKRRDLLDQKSLSKKDLEYINLLEKEKGE